MKRDKIIFLLLITSAAAIALYSFLVLTPSLSPPVIKQQVGLSSKIIDRKPPVAPKVPKKKRLVLDLDSLKVIEGLKEGSKTPADTFALKTCPFTNSLIKAVSQNTGSTTIYEEGRWKINGDAGLTGQPDSLESIKSIKDNLSITGVLSVDF